MDGCCATTSKASYPVGILSPDSEPSVVSLSPNFQPIAEQPVHLVFPRVQKTQKPPTPEDSGQDKRMVGQFMIEHNLPGKVEMGSIDNTQADGEERRVNQADSNAQVQINS